MFFVCVCFLLALFFNTVASFTNYAQFFFVCNYAIPGMLKNATIYHYKYSIILSRDPIAMVMTTTKSYRS